jgi:hypothetical protein
MIDKKIRARIVSAGRRAVEELIKVAEESILGGGDDGSDLSADKLKNAAATKRLAIFDAFDILDRIEKEESAINAPEVHGSSKLDINSKSGFAERYTK